MAKATVASIPLGVATLASFGLAIILSLGHRGSVDLVVVHIVPPPAQNLACRVTIGSGDLSLGWLREQGSANNPNAGWHAASGATIGNRTLTLERPTFKAANDEAYDHYRGENHLYAHTRLWPLEVLLVGAPTVVWLRRRRQLDRRSARQSGFAVLPVDKQRLPGQS